MSATQNTDGPDEVRALENDNLKRGGRLTRIGEFLKRVRRQLVVNRRVIGIFFGLLKLIIAIVRLLGSHKGD